MGGVKKDKGKTAKRSIRRVKRRDIDLIKK